MDRQRGGSRTRQLMQRNCCHWGPVPTPNERTRCGSEIEQTGTLDGAPLGHGAVYTARSGARYGKERRERSDGKNSTRRRCSLQRPTKVHRRPVPDAPAAATPWSARDPCTDCPDLEHAHEELCSNENKSDEQRKRGAQKSDEVRTKTQPRRESR